MRLGLREANQRFSKAVKAVRAGREVVLTERGRPFAVIKPLAPEKTQEAALQAMADEGLLVLPSRRGPLPAQRWRPPTVKGRPLSQTIVEDRGDRA
jgi:prevent-host-death family protein